MSEGGWLSVRAENVCAFVEDSVFFRAIYEQGILHFADTQICNGDPLFLVPGLSVGQVLYNGTLIRDGFKPMESGLYEFEVIVSGCTIPHKAEVELISCQPRLLVPNTFTPNGDGYNDRFRIEGLERAKWYELVVVNRWGNEVFRSSSQEWTGANQPSGAYFWSLYITGHDGESWKYGGFLHLVR